MNADVELLNVNTASGEPTADLLVRSGKLTGTAIEGAIIPTLIDELPVIAAMACYAEGTTVIRDAAELKVKESNRIAVMVENLTAMGADVTETEDGMIIHGGKPLHGAVIDSHEGSPHRHDLRRCRTRRFWRDRNSRCRLREHLLSGILWGSGTVV